MTDNNRNVVERYFQAMRAGAGGSDEMMSLFADDAVYVDPFGGDGMPLTHVGKDAIRCAFVQSQQHAPPDMTLSLDRVDVDGERVRSEWTCNSPAFPRPMRGQDLWIIQHGLVVRLETSFLGEA